MTYLYKTAGLLLGLSAAFSANAADTTKDTTNTLGQKSSVVCDATNSTDIVLLEVRSEVEPTLGSIRVEIDAMNLGSVPNVPPYTYNVYAVDAQGTRIEPAVETFANPFPFQPQELVTRVRYTTNLLAGNTYQFETVYPCSTNTNNNTVQGPVPGTITNPNVGGGGTIFRDGFESATAGGQYTVTEHKYGKSDFQISLKPKNPSLTLK